MSTRRTGIPQTGLLQFAAAQTSKDTQLAKLARAAPVFAALGDPTRLRVVARLCAHGPSSISGLSSGAKVTRQAITKHLQALSDAGLVRDRRDGRERIWELEPKGLQLAHHWLDEISAQWDAAIGRLQAFIGDDDGDNP